MIAYGRPRRGRRAFTLVEMLLTLTLAALLASAVFPAFQAAEQGQQVRHAADLLAASIDMARVAAVAHRRAVSILPLVPDTGFASGWRVVADDPGGGPALSVVRLRRGCLRIALTGSGMGRTGSAALHIAAVGYSRSQQGGFYAATFTLRCGSAQRQVRLGALGRLRLCTPGRDPDCDPRGEADP